MSTTKTKKVSAFKSPWVWAILGLFATIFVVNYGFISAALKTSPGLVTEEYYKYGLQQNKIDRQYRAQGVRGWEVSLTVPKPWQVNQSEAIALVVKDKAGNPLNGGVAEVTAYRPSDANEDITLQLKNMGDVGKYESSLTLPLRGVWDINILFTLDGEKHMLNERIIVQGDGPDEDSILEKIVNFILP